jgi:protein-S-isoprenylcysteine O-methyltransferase Ste14
MMSANTSVEQPQEKPDVKKGVTRWLIREILGSLFTAAILLGTAGRLDWVMAWVLVGVYLVWTGATALTVIPTNPEMLVERTGPKKGTKGWDMAILSLVGVLEMVKYVVAGLDMRWGWSPQIPLALQLVGVVVAVLANDVLLVWAMASNAFFSQTVRIQEERGHTVVTGGPYRYVRHPGYVGSILFQIATPLMLGSVWAFILAGLIALLTVVRTALEDRTLQEELDRYKEYSQRVRYRLLPGIW